MSSPCSDHAVVPYFNVEWFYDTRYDGWARTLYQLGPEVTVNKHFRYEIYLAHQSDHLPKHSELDALGNELQVVLLMSWAVRKLPAGANTARTDRICARAARKLAAEEAP